MSTENQNAIFEKGDRAPVDYFTGSAWVNILVNEPNPAGYRRNRLLPGKRKTHPVTAQRRCGENSTRRYSLAWRFT